MAAPAFGHRSPTSIPPVALNILTRESLSTPPTGTACAHSTGVGDSPYTEPVRAHHRPTRAAKLRCALSIGQVDGVDVTRYPIINDEDGFKLERAPDVGGAPGAWNEIASFNDTNAFSESFHDTNVVATVTPIGIACARSTYSASPTTARPSASVYFHHPRRHSWPPPRSPILSIFNGKVYDAKSVGLQN